MIHLARNKKCVLCYHLLKEVFEMFEVWDKKKITRLSDTEKQQWFDVLNHKLEEDRDISLDDPQLIKKQQEIKNDYIKYLESCSTSEDFYKYYIYKNQEKIISVCRIHIREGKYIIEGLQTHKNDYRMGYASKLIKEMINDLKNDCIDTLYSEARIWNDASNALQIKLGFTRYDQVGNDYLYSISF
jgi:RimJ/RimL family protein N-acetyltransferase